MKKMITLALVGLFVGGFAHAADKAVNYEDYIDYRGIGKAKSDNLSEMIKEARNEKEYRYNYDEGTLKSVKRFSSAVECKGSEGKRDIPVYTKDVVDVIRIPPEEYVLILKDKKWCYYLDK